MTHAMTDARRLELLHAEIDGELDSHGRAELARALLADPETRAVRNELRRVCGTLDAIGQADPPAELAHDILGALPAAASVPAQVRRRAANWSGNWRYAAVLAGVVVAAGAVFRMTDGKLAPATEVAGTLASPRAAEVIDSAGISGDAGGRASLIRGASGLQLEVELASGAPVDLQVASGEHTFTINGLRAGRTVVGLAGFDDAIQPLKLSFRVDGREVARSELKVKEGQ